MRIKKKKNFSFFLFGCFRISIIKNKNYKGGCTPPWCSSLYEKKSVDTTGTDNKTIPLSVRLYFQIGLHRKDETILNLIQSKLKVGKIYRSETRANSVEFQVSSFKDMAAIIKFFFSFLF
jgi:hypothetical protein